MAIFFGGAVRPVRALAASVIGAVLASSAMAAGTTVHRAPLLHAMPEPVANGRVSALGLLDGARRLKIAISLPWRNQAGLDALLAELYDPASPNFHKFLSVDKFTANYGPTQADYDTVVAWAKAQGLTVTNTPRNRHLVDVEGSVDDIDRAFHVTLTSYRHPTEARRFYAPDREPTLDVAVATLAITGLDDYVLPQRRLVRSDTVQPGVMPHAGGSGPLGQFLPSDMRAAYYGSGPLTGAGQTVGIFSFDGYKASDVQLYFSSTGMSSSVPITNVLVNGYSGACDDGGANCDDGEQVLDIVNVLGMAPGISQILFYEGSSGPDILNQMAADNIAKVLSCSWGSGDMGQAADSIFQEFMAQGQTFANATGDNGSYGSSSWLPPSLNPHILQVGGTDLTTASAGGAWAAETAWSDSGGGFYGAAGYSIPTYQQTSGVITATNAGSTTLRNDPDVSAEANFDNPTASNGRFLSGYGGTSFAAPRWAGFIALANEQAAVNGRGPLGFVNTALYAAAEANQAANFHDVASGSNGGFSAVAGYDLVTGWGSPNGATLINTLAGPASTPGFVVSAYPTNPGANPGASTTSTISIGALNGYTGNVTLSASGLPTGVTASFSPPSPAAGSSSTLTLSADNTVAAGTAAHVTITGTATGAATQTAAVNLLVGAPPAASLAPASLVFNDVPTGTANELLSIANGAQSLPLTYTIAAFASSGGACRGVVTWLAASVDSGSVTAGQPTKINVSVNPNGTLALGTYTAELCLVTNDGANPRPVVPVTLNIVQGPIKDTIFASSFEPGENGGANVVTYSLDQPIEDDQAGSALDLAEGFWHTWDNSIIDNINLFDDGTGLKVYWYDDKLPTQFANKVGGVVSGGNYAVLHAGAIVGPSSAFSRSVSTMTNWVAGTDGYLGIAFLNSQTNALNYGYLHLRTTGPAGFPAQVLDYGFDASGAAIEIP